MGTRTSTRPKMRGPASCRPSLKSRWPFAFKRGVDGEFALHVGDKKVQVSADYMTEDRRIPPPGKLHEWLRAIKEGKSEVDMRVPITKAMEEPSERVKLLDAWGVKQSILYIGHMIAALSYLDGVPEGIRDRPSLQSLALRSMAIRLPRKDLSPRRS
jgi:hypothetical protein